MGNNIALIELPESIGPAMRACSVQQRRFVMAMLETGGASYSQCAAMAGYSEGAEAQRGHECAHNPKVQAAMREEAEKRLAAGAILGASVLVEIARDIHHKDRYKAADRLLAHSGFIPETRHRVTVQDERSDQEIIARATEMALKLGIDPKKMMANYGIAIDAEFQEVKALPEPDFLNDQEKV